MRVCVCVWGGLKRVSVMCESLRRETEELKENSLPRKKRIFSPEFMFYQLGAVWWSRSTIPYPRFPAGWKVETIREWEDVSTNHLVCCK